MKRDRKWFMMLLVGMLTAACSLDAYQNSDDDDWQEEEENKPLSETWSAVPEDFYCLNVAYYVPADLDTLMLWHKRLSGITIHTQEFFEENMTRHGYDKTFGLVRNDSNRTYVDMDYIKSELPLDNLCIATPDVGGTKRASSYSKYLGVPMVICHKSRLRANEVAEMRIIGDVKGLDVLLVDDMVDTAGTITKAANLMMENGAKSVRAIASHAVMSDPASTRVDQSALAEIIFTDSIPYAKKCEKVKILSVAEMFAEAIRRVCSGESISSLYVI